MNSILKAVNAGFSSNTVLNYLKQKAPQAAYYINTAQNAGYAANTILKKLAGDNESDPEAYMTEFEKTTHRHKQNTRKASINALSALGTAGAVGAGVYGAYQANQAVQPSAVLPAQRPPQQLGGPGATINVRPRPQGGLPGPRGQQPALPAPRQMLQGQPRRQRLNAPPPARVRGKQPGAAHPPIPMGAPRDELPAFPELDAVKNKQVMADQLWNLAQQGKTGGNPFLKTSTKLVRDGTITDVANLGHFFDWWKATEGQQRGGPLVEYEKFRVQTKGMFEPPAAPGERQEAPRTAAIQEAIQQQPPQEAHPMEQQAEQMPEEAPQPQMEAPAGIRERTQQAAFAEQPELKRMLDHTFKGKEFSRPTYKLPGESAEDFRVRHTIDAAIKKTAKAITEGKTFLDFFERAKDPDMPGREIYRKPQDLKSGALSTADDILKYLAGTSGPYEMLLDDREKEELDNGIYETNIYGAQITPNMVWNLMMVIDPKLSTIKEIPAIKGGPKAKIPFNRTNAARYLTHAVYGVLSGKNISPELSDKIQRISNATSKLDAIAKAAEDGNFRRVQNELEKMQDDDYFASLFNEEVEAMVAQYGIKGMEPIKGSAADTRSANEIIKKREEKKQPNIPEDLIPLYDELKENGAEIDAKGNVTLYHRTTPENLEKILKTKKMHALEDGIFFSTSLLGQAKAYGDAVLKLKVPISVLQLDDVFGDEAHVRIPLKTRKNVLDISKYL